jgi:hypothetical protein
MSSGVEQKNYLFISNHCNHSKRLLSQIKNTNLIQNINLVNIDDPRVQLPAFVQCVPTLYLPTKRQVLTDNHLFQWIEGEIKNEQSNRGKINMKDITGDSNILPFQITEMGSGLSGSAYSFIDDSNNDLMNHNCSFLQDRDINKLPDFTRHDAQPSSGMGGGSNSANMNRKTGGETENKYEALMKARGDDMSQSRRIPSTPNFSSPY